MATRGRWLTLAQVADAEGVTERTIRSRVNRAAFPAPARFTRKNEPTWSVDDIEAAKTVTDPVVLTRDERNEVERAKSIRRLLDEVRWWVWEHGDARVPIRATGRVVNGRPFRLGGRVTEVRSAYRSGLLTAEEAAAFEALPGWTWDHIADSWKNRLDDVLTRWPTRLTSKDRQWLAVQRARYETYTDTRKAMLDSVPGLMTYKGNRRVQEFMEAVEAWLREHPGQTTYSIGFRDEVMIRGQRVPVGRRVTYYRRRYAGLEGRRPLSAGEIAAIEALPGWTWERSDRHVQAAQKVDRSVA